VQFGARFRYTWGQCGPNHKRKVSHITRQKFAKKSQQVKSLLLAVFPLLRTQTDPNALPLYLSVWFFRSFPVIAPHPGYFLLQPNVVFSHRLDPIPFHLSVLHGSRWMCECVHHSLPAPLRGVIVSCP